MKIKIAEYNPEWPNIFEDIKRELEIVLAELDPNIEHIGSTSVLGLAAKPVIDIAIGLKNLQDLDRTVEPMLRSKYIYFELHNVAMPFRRLYVGLKNKKDILKFKSTYSEGDTVPSEGLQSHRLCHIHIWEKDAPEWTRHIAFRDYLIEHPEVKTQYEEIKKKLSLKSWSDGNEYNEGKNSFIQIEQAKAVLWYNERQKTQCNR